MKIEYALGNVYVTTSKIPNKEVTDRIPYFKRWTNKKGRNIYKAPRSFKYELLSAFDEGKQLRLKGGEWVFSTILQWREKGLSMEEIAERLDESSKVQFKFLLQSWLELLE